MFHSPETLAGAAFVYGCFHAAGPGHGKSSVISHFLSREAKITRGLWMSVRIAATHTASALVLTFVLMELFRHALESVEEMRTLRLAAYGAIALLEIFSFSRTLRREALPRVFPCTGSLFILTFTAASGAYLTGMLMLIALGTGMTITLGTIGLLTIVARKRFALTAIRDERGTSMFRSLELAGQALTAFVNTALFITTLRQT
jgi:ABC-type nickel/cobalt efflux system permease component RcnA